MTAAGIEFRLLKDKSKWEKLAKDDKIRYILEKEDYKNNAGAGYALDDGTGKNTGAGVVDVDDGTGSVVSDGTGKNADTGASAGDAVDDGKNKVGDEVDGGTGKNAQDEGALAKSRKFIGMKFFVSC